MSKIQSIRKNSVHQLLFGDVQIPRTQCSYNDIKAQSVLCNDIILLNREHERTSIQINISN